MVSKWLLALIVPVAIVIFLWYSRTPPFDQSTVAPVVSSSTAGFNYWQAAGVGLVLIVLYLASKKAGIGVSYPEEQIKQMLRVWLREYEGMTLGDIWATVYDPESKHELVRIVFKVTHPEAYSDCFCYITFHRGRFEGLQKHLNAAECEILLQRRLRFMPKLQVKSSALSKLFGTTEDKEVKK
jgi:hypothetical protein